MKSCWVVMVSSYSPIAFVIPSTKAVFMNKREADKFCKEHNENPRTTSEYYARKAELK